MCFINFTGWDNLILIFIYFYTCFYKKKRLNEINSKIKIVATYHVNTVNIYSSGESTLRHWDCFHQPILITGFSYWRNLIDPACTNPIGSCDYGHCINYVLHRNPLRYKFCIADEEEQLFSFDLTSNKVSVHYWS